MAHQCRMDKELEYIEIRCSILADLIETVHEQNLEIIRLEAKNCAYNIFYNQVILPSLEISEEKIFDRNERADKVLKLINGDCPDLAGGISDSHIREQMILEVSNLVKSINCLDR